MYRLLLISLLLLSASMARGQYYNIHTWESFETAGIPKTMSLGHHADAESILTYPYTAPGTPAAMVSKTARLECGNYGLIFIPTKEKRHLSLFSPVSLERARLGNTGRALYQADFFLPAEGEPMPHTALLAAMANPDNTLSYKIYRFGILEGGSRVFFSYLVDDAAEPLDFQSQNISELNLTRPAWHRFQIIFVGQEDIYCCIDQKPTSFSPIKNADLQVLNPGLMVTVERKEPTPCIADNLSIQWSAEDVPLPDSPWVPRQVEKGKSLIAEGSPLPWYDHPKQAWTVSSSQRRPLLVLFYSPKIEPYQYLKDICPNDQEATEFLSQFVLTRIDANQLWGGSLAQQMKIMRLPTFIVLGPDGKEYTRYSVIRGQTQWSDIVANLTGKGDSPREQ